MPRARRAAGALVERLEQYVDVALVGSEVVRGRFSVVTAPPAGAQRVGRFDRAGARGAVRDGRGRSNQAICQRLFLAVLALSAQLTGG
jgi:hypothetical protein